MFLCIDIGGTKTLLALLSADGKILHAIKFPTIDDQDKFYATLKRQIQVNFVLAKVKAISVAMPGIVKRNKATYLGNLSWQDFDLAMLLQQDFAKPVFIENDANLAALAEARHCTGRSLYLTFSTGIGGGIVEDGRLIQRYRDFEPGHYEYVHHGQKSEWEDLAAASAINRTYGKLVNDITDPTAWQDIVERILLGLIPITSTIKPARIIFGGPLGLMLNHYRVNLRRALDHELPVSVKRPRLLVAKYGSYSVIYGSYFYAKAQLARR